MIKIKIKTLAFTLAEVLIVIGIIGIIAELTIPTLVSNIQMQVNKSKYKKTFSILNQVQLSIISDNSGSFKALCGSGDNSCVRNLFADKIKWIKKCEGSDINGNCWPQSWRRLNGDDTWSISYQGDESALVLADGTSVVFHYYNPNCDTLSGENLSECGIISIDTNGLEKPNRIGMDIFFAHIQENTIKPYGTPGDHVSIGYPYNGLSNYYACDPKGDGEICSFDYLLK